jgi:hypothetical protein
LGAEEASEALRDAVEGGVVVAVKEAIAGRARGGGVNVEDDAKGAGTATGRATAAAAVAEWMSKEAAGPAGGVRQRALVGLLREVVLLLVLPCSVFALNSSTAMRLIWCMMWPRVHEAKVEASWGARSRLCRCRREDQAETNSCQEILEFMTLRTNASK